MGICHLNSLTFEKRKKIQAPCKEGLGIFIELTTICWEVLSVNCAWKSKDKYGRTFPNMQLPEKEVLLSRLLNNTRYTPLFKGNLRKLTQWIAIFSPISTVFCDIASKIFQNKCIAKTLFNQNNAFSNLGNIPIASANFQAQ